MEQNFNNYAGIINVQDKYAESDNFYHIKGIAMKDETVILLEDKNVFEHELPMLNGQKTLFLLPKNSNYFTVSQVIENLKGI